MDRDAVDDIGLNFELGFGVILPELFVGALGGVDHKKFEEAAEREEDFLAGDDVPVEVV